MPSWPKSANVLSVLNWDRLREGINLNKVWNTKLTLMTWSWHLTEGVQFFTPHSDIVLFFGLFEKVPTPCSQAPNFKLSYTPYLSKNPTKLASKDYCRGNVKAKKGGIGGDHLQFCTFVFDPLLAGLKWAEVGQNGVTNLLSTVLSPKTNSALVRI